MSYKETKLLIYLADDDPVFSKLLISKLNSLKVGEIQYFSTGEELLANFNIIPDVAIVDYTLNTVVKEAKCGREVLAAIKIINPNIPVIMLTSTDKAEKAAELMHLGAIDYIIKDKEWFDNLSSTIFNLIEVKELKYDINILRGKTKKRMTAVLFISAIAMVLLSIIMWLLTL